MLCAKHLAIQFEREVEQQRAELYTEIGMDPDVFNIDSGDQLAAFLFSRKWQVKGRIAAAKKDEEWVPPFGFQVESRGRLYAHGLWTFDGLGLKKGMKSDKKNRPSTSTPALRQNVATARHEWVAKLLDYRRKQKMLTTYLRPWPEFTHAKERRIPDAKCPTHGQAAHLEAAQGVRSTLAEEGLQGLPVQDRVVPGTPGGQSQRDLLAAPLGAGTEVGSVPPAGDGGPPHQRGQERQPSREPDGTTGAVQSKDGCTCKYELEGARLYGTFNQAGTVTGRLSSSEPNLQNIPAHGPLGAKMRGLFVGDLVVADFGQLEPRLWAHFSKDPSLLRVFEQEHPDVYADMAERVYGRRFEKGDQERQNMKTYALALGYGAGPKKLAAQVSVSGFPQTVSEAEGILAELRRAYPVFFAWKDAVVAHAHRTGYVTTLAGRHRRLAANLSSYNWKNVGYGERQAVNAVIQGSAADVVRRTMIRIAADVPEVRQLAQIHDEVLMQPTKAYASDNVLAQVQSAGESGHGFTLNVALEFIPHRVKKWSEKS